jgi:hypothetical protein
MELAVLVAILVLALPGDAAAYIDPAAGSIVLQVVLGGVAGIAVIARMYYRKLLGLLGRGRADPEGPTGTP